MNKILIATLIIILVPFIAFSQDTLSEQDLENVGYIETMDGPGLSMLDIAYAVSKKFPELDPRAFQRSYRERKRSYVYVEYAYDTLNGQYRFLGPPIVTIDNFYLTAKDFFVKYTYWLPDKEMTTIDTSECRHVNVWFRIKDFENMSNKRPHKSIQVLGQKKARKHIDYQIKRPNQVIWQMEECYKFLRENSGSTFNDRPFITGFLFRDYYRGFGNEKMLTLRATNTLPLDYLNGIISCVILNLEKKEMIYSIDPCF